MGFTAEFPFKSRATLKVQHLLIKPLLIANLLIRVPIPSYAGRESYSPSQASIYPTSCERIADHLSDSCNFSSTTCALYISTRCQTRRVVQSNLHAARPMRKIEQRHLVKRHFMYSCTRPQLPPFSVGPNLVEHDRLHVGDGRLTR